MTITYPFSEQDAQAAFDEWGANCGPNALAFALQITLDEVRGTIPAFEEKLYTSPTMMRKALETLGRRFERIRDADGNVTIPIMFYPHAPQLVRVQWTGPWTEPGANPKWAYRQTHWIATFEREHQYVFDCNGGVRHFQSWQTEIVPLITSCIQRADGGWFPTHVWRIP